MSQIFVGQIMPFAGHYAPRHFMICDGQTLPAAQYVQLAALLKAFAAEEGTALVLPDLRGRAAVGFGRGPGLSMYPIGHYVGEEQVALSVTHNALHTHGFVAVTTAGTTATGAGNVLAAAVGGTKAASASVNFYVPSTGAGTSLSPTALEPAGAAMPHSNMQPYLPILMCICVQGVYPEGFEPVIG